MQLRVASAALTMVALGLGIAGCGSGSNASAITKVARTYTTAFADGDGRKACSQLTESEVTALLNSVSQDVSASSCAGAIQQVSNSLGGDEIAKLRKARLTGLRVNGTTAQGMLAGSSTTIRFSKIGGRWYISGGI